MRTRPLVALALLAVSTLAVAEESEAVDRFPPQVDSLALEVLESFPLQVTATLAGHLPDACSRIESVEERFEPEERTYHLELTAARDADAMCAQVVSPFELTVPIVKAGLATGEFRVEAHGQAAVFEVEPLGAFPGLDLPSAGPTIWMCVVEARLCFAAPRDWTRDGLTWHSSSFLSSRLGLRWWPDAAEDPQAHLPPGCELHDRTMGRLGAAIGTRMTVSMDEGRLWSEHLFARCAGGAWCEFWLEAPSEPLLDAAGEAFWRLVRFATSY